MADDISLTGKRWLPPRCLATDADDILADLLKDRKLHATPSSPLLAYLDRAVEMIEQAIREKRHIAIFGDYDCDGVTATALLLRYFRRRGTEPLVRLPHRVHDGYGLNKDIVEEFHKANVDLLITVDNGVSANEEIALAKSYGIQTIVTDHHTVGEDVPPADVVLHPGLSGCPLPHPSGAGVAFLLLSALEKDAWEERPTDLILAMCGTVADLVELQGFNRQLVREGLEALQTLEQGPLVLLREMTKAKSSTDVAFRIAPRINAAGRMGDPLRALEALLEGGSAVEDLDALNKLRQDDMQSLLDEARDSVDVQSPLIFSADANYAHGLLGLLAGRLTEETGHPSCIVTIEGEQCTASLRSPACYHITEGLQRCSDLLTRFGGHAQAAGCNLRLKDLDAFRKKLTDDVDRHTGGDDLTPSLHIDARITPEHLRIEFCKALSTLEPFGAGNPEPRFLLEGVAMEGVRAVGRDDSHLQCTLAGCKAIGFNLAPLQESLEGSVDALCRIQMDEWNGYLQPQLVVEDVRTAKKMPVGKNG